MNLKVNIDKIVTISIPRKMSLEKAKEFVVQKANWIKKQQNFYNKFISKKENLIFENGDTVYLIGEQYNIKLIKDTKNNTWLRCFNFAKRVMQNPFPNAHAEIRNIRNCKKNDKQEST